MVWGKLEYYNVYKLITDSVVDKTFGDNDKREWVCIQIMMKGWVRELG